MFEEFYRRHVAAVTRFMARRAADPHAVADLTADVFLAVIGSAHTYRPGLGTELAWLYGIARNVIAGEARRAAQEVRAAGLVAGRRLLDGDDIARLEERVDAESAARHRCQAQSLLPCWSLSLLTGCLSRRRRPLSVFGQGRRGCGCSGRDARRGKHLVGLTYR
jgi:RNA polymerase sigma-70 factor (ECF subfamily)